MKNRLQLPVSTSRSGKRGHTTALLDAVVGEKKVEQQQQEEKKVIDDPQLTEEVEVEPSSLAEMVGQSLGATKKTVKKSKEGESGINLDPDVIPEGKGIGPKFKAYAAKITALESQLAAKEAELTAAKAAPAQVNVEETEPYKKLKEEYAATQERLEQVDFIGSPRFQETFEAPRQAIFKKCKPYLSQIEDEGKRNALAGHLDLLRTTIPPGEDNDGVYYYKVGKALDSVQMTGMSRGQLENLLIQERELTNKQNESIVNWKTTKEKLGGIEDQSRLTAAKAAEGEFDRLVTTLDSTNPGRQDFLVKSGLAETYKDLVVSKRAFVKSEIAKSTKAGVLTPALLELVHLGHEYGFQSEVNTKLMGLLKDVVAERDKAKAQFEALKAASPNRRQGNQQQANEEGGEPKSLKEMVSRALAGA